jgi:hypothetical protein
VDWSAVDRLARTQIGLVTRAQLQGFGLSDHGLRWAVTESRLVPVRRGVCRVAGVPTSQDQAWLAAVLASPPGHVLSHGSVARAWGLRGFVLPDRIDVLNEGRSRTRLEGVQGHRTERLPPRDRTSVRRIPATTVERTFVDACGYVTPRMLGRSVDDAVRRGLMTLDGLIRCAASVPLSGRRASRPIRAVLAERVPGYDPGGSAEELDVMRVLREAGIRPLPVQQYRIRIGGQSFRLDYAWPDTKHSIEYLGAAWHGTPSALHDDSARRVLLQRGGWTEWPVTAYTNRVEIVAIGEIATSLSVRSHGVHRHK